DRSLATRFETSAGQVWTFARDDQDRITAFTDPLGRTVRHTFQGDADTVAGVTDARGNTTSFQTDAYDNTLAITYPGGGAGPPVSAGPGTGVERVTRRGRAVQPLPNADGQVARRVFEDGSATAYAYDARGNVTSATDAAGTTTMSYFPDDRLQKITYPDG